MPDADASETFFDFRAAAIDRIEQRLSEY